MKTFYLKESLKTYSEFQKLNEEIDIEKTQDLDTSIENTGTETEVISGDNISGEIDTILDKLKELENGIDEEIANSYLSLLSSGRLDEADGKLDAAMAKIKDFMIVAPKVTKMQKKANKVRLNKEVLDMTVQNPEIDGAKKKSLEQKRDGLKDQLKELEAAVATYQKDNGGKYSARKLAKTKIEGQLAAIKKKTGMSDDPKQQKSLQQDAQELATRYKEEVAATKTIAQDEAPSPEEQEKFKIKQIKDKISDIKKEKSGADNKTKAALDVKIEELNVKVAVIEGKGETEAKDKLQKAKDALTKANEEPAAKKPADETPATETPAAKKPADETPADETPATETPAAKKPADETPAAKKPADETPAAKKPADETEEEKKKKEEK